MFICLHNCDVLSCLKIISVRVCTSCFLTLSFLFFDSLAVAKLDVLDTFEEVKIGISYKHKGKVLDSFPGKKTSFFFHKTVVGVSKTPTLGHDWDFSFSAFHVASFSFLL